MEHTIGKEQMRFSEGKLPMSGFFLLNQVIKKRLNFHKKLIYHIGFIDFKKTLNNVFKIRNMFSTTIKKIGYYKHLIKTVKSLYGHTNITIDNNDKQTKK